VTGTVSGGGSASSYVIVGGLVGFNLGTIIQSHATGAVRGGSYAFVGGLVGYDFGGTDSNGNPISGASIANSYASGAVSSAGVNIAIGGLVGLNGPRSLITNSQAYGAVTSTAATTVIVPPAGPASTSAWEVSPVRT
jgi:hypothetical protein